MAENDCVRIYLEPRYQNNQQRGAGAQRCRKCGSCAFGQLMAADSDTATILPLILLLLLDGGDMALIFALIYILI